MRNEVLNIFSSNNCLKKTTFSEKIEKKIFRGQDHFLDGGHFTPK